jgi:hypothetical protein
MCLSAAHYFLFSHPYHQEELTPQLLLWVTDREELFQVLPLVHLRLLFQVARPIVLTYQTANPLRLQEGHDIREFVPTGARMQFLFVAEEG